MGKVSCFYHKMHDSLNFGHLAAGLGRFFSKSSYDEWLIIKLCLHMRDGAIHYKLYLLKFTMAVDNIVFRIIKGAF